MTGLVYLAFCGLIFWLFSIQHQVEDGGDSL